jgi:hypothetical protein
MSRHYEIGLVPVCIVTTLKNEILFSHTICNDEKGNLINPWVVSSMRCNITRFWATSSAMITLKCAVENLEDGFPTFSNLPPAGKYISDKEFTDATNQTLNKDLYIFDEIRIWLGYLDYVNQPLQELGDIFSPENPLGFDPVFIGYIETIKSVGTAKGMQVTLECYDRIKYLLNTRLITIPTIDTALEQGQESAGAARTDILLDLVNQGIGDIGGGALQFQEDPITKRELFNYDPSVTDPEVIKQQIRSDEDWTLDILTGTKDGKANDWTVSDKGRFYRLTTRENVKGTDNDAVPLISLGDAPIEKIRILALIESSPTEFFQSAKNGNLYYLPRLTDESGFESERKLYRTYFFKSSPKGTVPCSAQRAISMKSEISGAGLRTDVWINTANSSEATRGTKEALNMHIRTIPNRLLGKAIPQSNHILFDQYTSSDLEAYITAVSMASIWSREVQAAMMQVMGDGSMTPGEAVKIYGFGMLSNGASSPAAGSINSLIRAQEELKIDTAKPLEPLFKEQLTDPTTKQINTGSPNPKINEATQKIAAVGVSYYTDEKNPFCVMRVQAVMHDFASSGAQTGWKTEVALSSTF